MDPRRIFNSNTPPPGFIQDNAEVDTLLHQDKVQIGLNLTIKGLKSDWLYLLPEQARKLAELLTMLANEAEKNS